MSKIVKYGHEWKEGTHPLTIEFWNIRKGKKWVEEHGRTMFQHYREAAKLLWPDVDHHRWFILGLKTICESDVTVLMGCGDSNKTFLMSQFALMDWWADPERTLWLISSTEYRGAELRIWGKIKELYNKAKTRFDWLPGNVLESMHAITTDEIDDDREFARSLQKGLIFVPCKKGTTYVGLSAFVGVKSPRLRHAGDEVQAMSEGFLDAYSNWYGKADFKGIMAGNPSDVNDPLCKAAEPPEGWESFIDTEKTQTWKSKFYDASVVAYDGRDSPNFDFPDSAGVKYPYLIGNKKLDGVRKTHGTDSWQWFHQCVGKPNMSMDSRRVITARLCQQHHALDIAIWQGTPRTWIYGLDPAYGGGDRCVGIPIEFGTDVNGVQVAKIYPPEIIVVSLKINKEPEQQIAEQVKLRLSELDISPDNCFYDSFGKGTLGYAFSRVFGSNAPIPVDSSAKPSKRPARYDVFVEEPGGNKRLMRSDEYYSKRVSEMWYSVREAIESEQIRELPKSTMNEGCLRMFDIVAGNKVEVEPKDEMKERTRGKSPDEFDALSISIEGARQRGFKIQRLGAVLIEDESSQIDKDGEEYEKLINDQMLVHT